MVGNKYCGGALSTQQVRCERAECFPKLDIKVTEGFIQQEKSGLRGEGPSEGNALSFPSGELMRKPFSKADKANLLKKFIDP